MILLIVFAICYTLLGYGQHTKPILRMQDFIGVNLREGDPLQYANCAGFAREYHEWPNDEGNHLALSSIPNAPQPQPYPNNRYAWNTGAWQSNKQYDNWYFNLRNRLDESNNNVQPICATLKSCLPYVAGTTNWTFGSESELIPVEGSRTDLNNRKNPASYKWYADWVYQFTKKFGSNNANLNSFKPAGNEPANLTNIGINRVGYIELWNEPDKYWFNPPMPYQFSGDEYAALACATYYGRDGNSNNLTALSGTTAPISYNLGIRNSDPNMRVVLGGTAGIRDFDSNFILNIKNWFSTNTDATVRPFPFDVINLHHYNSTKWDGIQLGQIETTSRSPEADHWLINGVDKKFKQRLKDIKTLVDGSFSGRELWLSEFGFDTNENSPYRTPNITTNGFTSDRQEVQGQWLLRGFMEIASAGWDRAMQFCIRDEDPNDAPVDVQGVFKASGLVRAKELGFRPKKSYYYVHSMKEILKDTKFDTELSTDPSSTSISSPRIMRFKKDKTTLNPNVFGDYVYSVWLPTSNNEKIVNQKIYLGSTIASVSTNATLVTLKVDDLNGVRTALTVSSDANGFFVTIPEVSERPVFFILGGSQPDIALSIPTVSAVGISCNGIKATWTWSGGRPNVSRYSVYYYEKNDSEENATESKALNISDKNLVLFSDNLSGSVNEVLITGLKKTLDQYYIFIKAVDINGVVTDINTNSSGQGWNIATTLSCPNNIITGITAGATTDASIRAANQLFNYGNIKFCYPQDAAEIADIGEWVRTTEPANTTLTGFLNLNDNYIIEGIAVLDGTGEGNLTISASQPFNTYLTILNYQTEYYNEWKYFPISNVQTNAIKIELQNDFAKLKKVILYGRKANTSLLTNCLNCDAVSTAGLTIVGTNSGSITTITDLKNQNLLSSNTAIGKNIRVNGRLIIDQDFTFDQCSFSMKPASAITVQTTKQLNLTSSAVDGCDQMWKGITIESGGRIELNKTALRDAEIGLKFERSSNSYEYTPNYRTFGLIDSRIERNSMGLLIDAIYPSGAFSWYQEDITSNSFISGTSFDGTEGDLKPCYTGQATSPNLCIKKATIGLSITNAFINTYTGSTTKINQIKNVAQGIFTINSYLALVTTKFTNIQPVSLPNPWYDPMYYPYPTYQFGGQGVEMYLGYLNQRGLGSNLIVSSNQIPIKDPNNQSAPLTFDNVYQPFYVYNSWFNIYGNKIRGGQQEALYNNINAPINYSCYFENNYVSTKADGIKAYGIAYPGGAWQNGYGVKVIDNIFENEGSREQNSPIGTGITVSSYAQPANVGVEISRNYVQTQNGNSSVGIALWGTLNSSIQDNTISLQSFSSTAVNTGFNLINNTSATIANNTVIGQGNSNNKVLSGWPNNIGMYIQSSPTNTIRCNTLKNTKYGIQFVGMNESTNGIKGNTLDGYYQAFSLLDNTSIAPQPVIGAQAHMGNKWIPVDGGMGRTDAEWQNFNANANIFAFSKFNTDQSLGGNFNPNVVTPSSGWFIPTTSTQGTYSCATNSGGGFLAPQGIALRGIDDFEEVYQRFTNKDAATTSTESSNATEWVLRRNTYKAIKKLGNNSSGTTEDKRNRDKFAQKHANSSVNDFNDMDEQMAGLFDKKTADDTRLEQVGNEIVTLMKDNPNTRMTASLGQFMKEYYKLLDKHNKKIKTDVEQLKALNSRISVSKPYEIYEKQVNDIYLTTIGQAKIMLTIQQENLLREIAVKCPAEVGLASYKARILWNMVSREKLPDWHCDNVQPIIPNSSLNAETSLAFSLNPNPTQNELTINFISKDMEGLSWEISNLSGTKMSTGLIQNNGQKVNTQQLVNGIYYMNITKEGKSISVQKFVILH